MIQVQGVVERIYVAPRGGEAVQRVEQAEALAGCGLRDDRYCRRTGFWTGVDECQVTLIEAEHLEEIERTTGIHVVDGEHRRNLVTRGVRLDGLRGRQFRVGGAVLAYNRPRPPCAYVESLTEPGMTQALAGRGGICADVVESGTIRVGDAISILPGETDRSPG